MDHNFLDIQYDNYKMFRPNILADKEKLQSDLLAEKRFC